MVFGLGGRQNWRNWCVILRLNCVAKAWCQQPIENISVSRVKREGYPRSFACCIARRNVNNLSSVDISLCILGQLFSGILVFLQKKKYFWQICRNNQSIVLLMTWCWGLAPFLGHTCNRKLWQSTAGPQCHTASCRADFGWFVLNLDTSLFLPFSAKVPWLWQTLYGFGGLFLTILNVWCLGVKLSIFAKNIGKY